MAHLLTLNQPSAEAISWSSRKLIQAGLQVFRSFDLQTVMGADTPCTCPHHEANCDCDMVVLLVYGVEQRPATIVSHSHNGRTRLSLADGPGERPSPELCMQIKSAVTSSDIENATVAQINGRFVAP